MRKTTRKYSRQHGWMEIRSYAPGDGSIDFSWIDEKNPLGNVLEEPVTESDVSEWLRLKENAERFKGWEILVLGRCSRYQVPYDVRIAQLVERPFHTSKRLVMDEIEYEYVFHGKEPRDGEFRNYHSGNTTFYGVTKSGRRAVGKVVNMDVVSALCFFLNHESDFKANGFRTRGTAKTPRELCNQYDSLRKRLKPIPKSLVGSCVGHHPNRKIWREVEVYDEDPFKPVGTRFIVAHPVTGIDEGDFVLR